MFNMKPLDKMNKTEKIAFKWLIDNQKINPDDIIYSYDSPDFIDSSTKRGYEVKKLCGAKIMITEKQFSIMKQKNLDIDILVMKDNVTEPIEIIPFDKIDLDTKIWKNIQIYWEGDVKKESNLWVKIGKAGVDSVHIHIPKPVAEIKEMIPGGLIRIKEGEGGNLMLMTREIKFMCAGCGKAEVKHNGDICVQCEIDADKEEKKSGI